MFALQIVLILKNEAAVSIICGEKEYDKISRRYFENRHPA
jgi:tRNA(Ser,Leu) C12 N-acetylase TAN1